jgi:hypothetical protein
MSWTTETYTLHNEAMRRADERWQAEHDLRLTQLRQADQRALEIKSEGEKESKRIKEAADDKALTLAREIQTYKDEKANELREQINRERGLYATKEELIPIMQYIAGQTGVGQGKLSTQGLFLIVIPGFVLFILTLIGTVAGVVLFLRP